MHVGDPEGGGKLCRKINYFLALRGSKLVKSGTGKLPDSIAFSQIFKEFIDRLVAAFVEGITSTNPKLFEISTFLGEMTQPAELLTAAWTVFATIVGLFTDAQTRWVAKDQ